MNHLSSLFSHSRSISSDSSDDDEEDEYGDVDYGPMGQTRAGVTELSLRSCGFV